jgi:hypothetical protein
MFTFGNPRVGQSTYRQGATFEVTQFWKHSIPEFVRQPKYRPYKHKRKSLLIRIWNGYVEYLTGSTLNEQMQIQPTTEEGTQKKI